MIKLKNISKAFIEGDQKKFIFDNAQLEIPEHKLIIILGNSGSGKTTLLNIISGIDDIDSGEILLDGKDIASFDEEERTEFRKQHIGFVFQFYNLVPTLSVEENILLPLELCKKKTTENVEYVMKLLDKVGLLDRKDSYPDTLSGGEQQRVSLVRALAHKPRFLIADEPTGNLDKNNTVKIYNLIKEISSDIGVQLIMATHNAALIEEGDIVVEIENKQLSIR